MGLVLKNGVTVGWANISAIVGGVVLTGIKSLDFQANQKKENIYGAGAQPIGRGRGQNEYPNAMMEILLEEWKALCTAAPNRDPFQLPMFNIPVVYDNNVVPQETLNNVEFISVSRPYKSGDTALWVSVGIIYAGINQ
jgi:hypothetical protein